MLAPNRGSKEDPCPRSEPRARLVLLGRSRTVNAQKTKTFYGELFGWKYEDKPAGEFGRTRCAS
jgi:hypothetical protein